MGRAPGKGLLLHDSKPLFEPLLSLTFHPQDASQCVLICIFLFIYRYLSNLKLYLNTLRPRRHFQTIFSNAFSWTKMYEFYLRFLGNFVLKVWNNNIPALVQIMALGRPATSHYLNQWLLIYWPIYASLGFNELKWNNVCHLRIIIAYVLLLNRHISTFA